MSPHVLLRTTCFLFSNRAHNEDGEKRIVIRETETGSLCEKDTYKICGVVYVDRILPEENKEGPKKRFNIPIILKTTTTRRRIRRNKKKGKDD